MTRIDPKPPRAAWGNRSQIGGTLLELRDLQGNGDGIWGNEGKGAGTTGDVLDRNPLALRLRTGAGTGLSVDDEIGVLHAYRAEREATWGAPVMDPAIESALNCGAIFAAQKAIAITRLGRAPADVSERFVEARGSVDGTQVPPSRVFTQHWRPSGPATGEVVVMSPGFLETGQAFLDEVKTLNAAGAHVVVMDHQWAGHTQGKKGGIHSGESVALHTAAVLADAWQIGRELYGDTARLTVVGESLGGGPGALGALVAHQAGLLTLEGAAFPPGPIAAVLQAPFLGAKKNFINSALAAAAQLPLLNRIPMWGLGLPDFVDDKRGEHRVAQQMVLGDIRGQLQAFKASDRFLARVQGLLAAGTGPGGPVHIIHDDKDPLADYAGSVELKRLLGDGARLTTLSRGNHGLSASDADLCAEVIMAMLKRP